MKQVFDGFTVVRRGQVHALAATAYSAAVESALLDKAGCYPLNASGRGDMLQFSLADGVQGVLRICRRGGLLGRILKEGFLLSNRPFKEFCTHLIVLQRGVAAPALLGVQWERRGVLFYGALATALLPGADLHTWLRDDHRDTNTIQQILKSCGVCIRAMHDKGVWHADLQLKNLVIADTGIFLLDFDKAHVHDNLSNWKRARNLLRLRRSFEKLGYPSSFWHYTMAGYDYIHIPRTLRLAYRAKACFSDMIQGRRNMQV